MSAATAAVAITENGVRLYDLDSVNGTYVDDETDSGGGPPRPHPCFALALPKIVVEVVPNPELRKPYRRKVVASAFDERLLPSILGRFHAGWPYRGCAFAFVFLMFRSELNRRCLTVIHDEGMLEYPPLPQLPAAPDSENRLPLKKESFDVPRNSGSVSRVFDGYSDRCVSDVHDGVCRSHIMPRRAN